MEKAKPQTTMIKVREFLIKLLLFLVLSYVLVDIMNYAKNKSGVKFFSHKSGLQEIASRDEKRNANNQLMTSLSEVRLLDIVDKRQDVRAENPDVRKDGQCSQAQRLARIERECERRRAAGLPITNQWTLDQKLAGRHILVDDANKLLYCVVPKAASTSWKILLLTLNEKFSGEAADTFLDVVHQNQLLKNYGLQLLETLPRPQQLYRIEHYTKMLVPRHPLSRLVSAYEHQMLTQEWYHLYVGKWIMRHYRKNPTQEDLDTGHNVTFSEFVQFITNERELKVHQLHDHQWYSVEGMCSPCLYKYDFVAKFETLEDDFQLLMKKIAPNKNVTFPKYRQYLPDDKEKIIKKHLNSLSYGERAALYELYKQDFSFFDYDVNDDFQIGCGKGDGCC